MSMNIIGRDSRVHAHWDWNSQRVEVRLLQTTGIDPVQYSVGKVVEYTRHEFGEPMPPTFSLDSIGAQQMMDNLWNCGFRPTEGTGSAGAMAATQKHLEDMRRIAFSNLNLK